MWNYKLVVTAILVHVTNAVRLIIIYIVDKKYEKDTGYVYLRLWFPRFEQYIDEGIIIKYSNSRIL